MDEETIDAAARAISFLGEAALRASAADLVTRARSVALAAEGANADHIPAAAIALNQVESGGTMLAVSGLRGAATALEEVESEGRTRAVSGLLGAATALQAVLGVGHDNLRDAAADLARQCGEHREAAAAMEKVRRAVEEQSHRNRSAPWWLFWRRRGHRIGDVEQTLLATGSTPTALQGAARTAIDFVRNEAARPDHLVKLAGEIVVSAENLAVPHQSLVAARDALQQADSPSSVKAAVNGLEAAAMGVKGAANSRQIILRNPVVQLAAACQEYLKASDAMAAVQHAATQRARQRESAVVPGQNAPPPPPPPTAPGPGQGDERRSGWLEYALCGSLTLAPYLAATNGNPAKNLVLAGDDRWHINLALSLWWTIVASGAVCSSYARSWIEVCYAQLAARVGMYGINIFAIHFYWMLGIENNNCRRYCLWFATALHFMFLVLACCRRDP
ncbi:uncharacterized protein [Miscanthus floridulus]|uniref:uncharacterized protein isoform X2 n=1 Tax=Miscanthus floridulus TaxID=154761 RepID=UPI00345825D1